MKLVLNHNPEVEEHWKFLFKIFNTGSNDQNFLRAVLQEEKISSQIGEERVQAIFDTNFHELKDFYSLDKFFRLYADYEKKPNVQFLDYCRFVIDKLQNSCRGNIIVCGEKSLLFSCLRNLENRRVGNLSSIDEIYISKGAEFLAEYLGQEADSYQSYLINNLKKGASKPVPIAIKILKILGDKPNYGFSDEEYSRFEKYKRFGEGCFNDVLPRQRTTLKATTIQPLSILGLNQADLKNIWASLVGSSSDQVGR